MPNLPNVVEGFVNALNRANSVTLVNPADIELVSSVADSWATSRVALTIRGKANKPNYGTYTALVRRVHLAAFFASDRGGLGTTLSVPPVATIKDLLSAIGYRSGFQFPDGVIEDGAITWTNGTASVLLVPKKDNPYFYDRVILTLTAQQQNISTLLNRNYFSRVAIKQTAEQVYGLIAASNQCPIPTDQFDFSAPMTTAEAGATYGSYNSVIRITPKLTSGYMGTYNMFFTRVVLSNYTGMFSVPDDFKGTLREALQYETLNLRTMVDLDELDLPTDILDLSAKPLTITLKAKPGSFVVFGETTLTLTTFSEDTKDLTINFTTNRTNMTASTLSDLCKASVPRAGRLRLTINVAQDIYLVGNTVTEYGLSIQNMPQYGEIVLELNNRGIISGRGAKGSDTGWANPAGSGLFIDPVFKGRVTINNFGTIAGGGGGGGMSSGLMYIGGGGGRPLGEASNTRDSGSFYYGPAATLAAPGPRRVLYRSDTLYYAGGAGGDLGCPGRVATQINGSIDIESPLAQTTFSQATAPAEPGKAVVDTARIAVWSTRGVILPPLQDYSALLDSWLDSLGLPVTADSLEMDIIDPNGKYVVSLDGATDFYTDRSGWTMANKLQSIGAVWGEPIQRHFNGRMAGVINLGMESGDVFRWNYRNKKRVYIEFTDTTTRISGAIKNRNFINAAALSTADAQCRVTRLVYYDPWRGMVVDVNPYLKTIQPFTGFEVDLNTANGELDGFK